LSRTPFGIVAMEFQYIGILLRMDFNNTRWNPLDNRWFTHTKICIFTFLINQFRSSFL
jgi:hypothetical protein